MRRQVPNWTAAVARFRMQSKIIVQVPESDGFEVENAADGHATGKPWLAHRHRGKVTTGGMPRDKNAFGIAVPITAVSDNPRDGGPDFAHDFVDARHGGQGVF